jgi:hypothetical protein
VALEVVMIEAPDKVRLPYLASRLNEPPFPVKETEFVILEAAYKTIAIGLRLVVS